MTVRRDGFTDETPYDRLLTAAAEYLEEQGAKVTVIGGVRIQHWPEEAKYNHELVIKFMGVMRIVSAE